LPPHRHLHSFPTRRSSDLVPRPCAPPRARRPSPRESVYTSAVAGTSGEGALMPTYAEYLKLDCLLALQEPGADHDEMLFIIIHRSEEHTSELQSPCNLVCR